MKKISFLNLFIGAAILFNFSCKKEKLAPYVISGHLYSGCPKMPAVNIPVQLIHTSPPHTFGGKETSEIDQVVYTDANGFFRFTSDFNGEWTLKAYEAYWMHSPPPSISSGPGITGLELYKATTLATKIFLNVTTHYTAADTLHFYVMSDPVTETEIKILGPFNSGPVYVSNNHFDELYVNSVPLSNDSYYSNINGQIEKYSPVHFIPCDTSTVTIDIN